MLIYKRCGCGCKVQPPEIGGAHTCACEPKSGRARCVRATQKTVATHTLSNTFIHLFEKENYQSTQMETLQSAEKKSYCQPLVLRAKKLPLPRFVQKAPWVRLLVLARLFSQNYTASVVFFCNHATSQIELSTRFYNTIFGSLGMHQCQALAHARTLAQNGFFVQ